MSSSWGESQRAAEAARAQEQAARNAAADAKRRAEVAHRTHVHLLDGVVQQFVAAMKSAGLPGLQVDGTWPVTGGPRLVPATWWQRITGQGFWEFLIESGRLGIQRSGDWKYTEITYPSREEYGYVEITRERATVEVAPEHLDRYYTALANAWRETFGRYMFELNVTLPRD